MGTKDISTLVFDINLLIEAGALESQAVRQLSDNLAETIASRMNRDPREPHLRMSNAFKPCERQLWYEINYPELGEKFRSETYLKFLYGDILEELLLFLAAEAGHEVTGRQDTVEVQGIKGHRDAVIDGLTVDAKSASSFSFSKFRNHLKPEDDGFGYLGQLRGYVYSGRGDPLVTNKEQGAFLVIDKTLGHICLDIHNFSFEGIEDEFSHKKAVVTGDRPMRGFSDEPFGASGNKKLGFQCAYCAYKFDCWKTLRAFAYSTGPVFLTEVKLLPKVPEIVN